MTNRQTINYRRKREGRTDYRRRLNLLKSGKARLAVRASVNNTIVSVASFNPDGDKIVTTFHSKDLKKKGWKHGTGNLPSAYLTGYFAAKSAMEKGVSEAILDIGSHESVKGSRVFAALKGAVDAGLSVPHSEDAFPTEERLMGAHIESHLNKKIQDDVKALIK